MGMSGQAAEGPGFESFLALTFCQCSFLWPLGSGIWTSVDDIGSKTRLTCALNHSTTEIVGHRWVKGGKVLKEDALPDLKTEYE